MSEQAAPETTEQAAPPATSEPAPQTSPEAAPESPDVSEQIALMQQEIQSLKAPAEEAPEIPSLSELLMGTDYEEPVEGEPEGGQPEGEPQQLTPEQEKLAQIEGYLISQEEAKRATEIEQISKDHPEMMEPANLEKLADKLEPYAARYGDEAMTDPGLIRSCWAEIKAETASAAETPAEQARNRGATLETDAGASDAGEADPIQAMKDSIIHSGGTRSAFG